MLYLLLSVGPNLVVGLVASPAVKAAVTYASLVVPVNQFVSGVSCCLWIQAVATLEDRAPAVGDFFVFSFRAPGGAAAPLPGPLVCVAYALASIAVYGAIVYVVDVRVLLYPGVAARAAAPPPPPPADEDADVAAERARVAAGAAGDALVVEDLAKSAPRRLIFSRPPSRRRA